MPLLLGTHILIRLLDHRDDIGYLPRTQLGIIEERVVERYGNVAEGAVDLPLVKHRLRQTAQRGVVLGGALHVGRRRARIPQHLLVGQLQIVAYHGLVVGMHGVAVAAGVELRQQFEV